MRMRITALFLLCFIPMPAHALTDDLAMVPNDALIVAHLRAADLWKHDILKGLRDTIAAAGPKAIEAFEKQVYPHPEALDRITVVLRLEADEAKRRGPLVTIIVAFKKDVDSMKLAKLYFPNAQEKTVAGRKVMADEDSDVVLLMHDAKHLVIGPMNALESFLAKGPGKGDGPLAGAYAAAGNKILTVAANIKGMPFKERDFEQIPPDLRPLARAETVLLTLDGATANPVIELKAAYADDNAVADAEKAVKSAVAMAKEHLKQPRAEMEKKLYENADKGPQPAQKMGEAAMALVALGALNRAEAHLDKLPITRSGKELHARVEVPAELVPILSLASASLGVLMPSVANMKAAAGASVSANNMKQLGLAFHIMHDKFNKMPGAAICDKDGKPLLSWRVAILPYIEQDALYQQFRLDEPWDSPNNKPLIEKMPKIYVSPRVPAEAGKTVYKVFVGKNAMFQWNSGTSLSRIPDGTSNTIMTIEAGEPVVWTKPEEIEFDRDKPLPKLALPGGAKTNYVGMGDGSVHLVDLSKFDEKTLKNFIDIMDGNVTPPLDGDAPRRFVPMPSVKSSEVSPGENTTRPPVKP